MSAAADSRALLDQAMARLNARDFRAAAALFNRAIALGRDAPEIRNNLGQALRFSGDQAGAEAAYREALRQRPSYVRATVNLAELLLPAGADAAAEVISATLAAGTVPSPGFGGMPGGRIVPCFICGHCWKHHRAMR
jgi:Flp pilus assembly protein TadD